MRPSGRLIGLGLGINLLVLSVPLLVSGSFINEYFCAPAIWAYFALLSAFYLVEVRASGFLAGEETITARKPFLPHLTGLMVLLIFWASAFGYAVGSLSPLRIGIASTIVISGITLRYISIATLRECFISKIGLRDNHTLVTHGIYAIIRHPSEVGLLLICGGIALLLSSISGALCVVLLGALTLYRVWLEDNILAAAFPDCFAKYKAATGAFWPRHLLYTFYRRASR